MNGKGENVKRVIAWAKDNKFLLLISALAIGYVGLPLATHMMHSGEDLGYHLLRIENISEGLKDGQFPVKIGPIFLNGYGYASSLCYPELFLYIPAVLRILGVGIEPSYKVFAFLCIAGSYLTMFYAAYRISGKEKTAASVAAIVYTMSQYHLANLYTRGSLGETQAFVFFPLVIYGLYNLIFEEYERPWVLGIGFWGLMYSHTISLVSALCVAFVLCLIYFKRVVLNGRKFVKLCLTAVIVLMATAAYWMPFLEQLLSLKMRFGQPWTLISDNAALLPQIFSINFLDYTYNFDIAILLMCLLALVLPKCEENKRQRRTIRWFLIMGFATLWVTSDYFPWKLVQPLLNNIQFPWRFYAIASLFLAVAIGLMAVLKFGSRYRKEIMTGVLACMVLSGTLYYEHYKIDYYDIKNDFYTYGENTFNLVQGEWLPKSAEEKYFQPIRDPKTDPEVKEIVIQDRIVRTDDGRELEFSDIRGQGLQFDFEGACSWLDVPLVWYKGYTAWLTDESGKRTPCALDGNGFNGTVRLYPESTVNGGTMTVKYTGTAVQHLALLLNTVTLAALAVWWLIRRRKEKSSNVSGR